MVRSRLLGGVFASALGFMVSGGVAMAQTQPSAKDSTPPAQDAGAESTQVETVTVTAQKRAENVQDVPLAVTALGGDALRQQNVFQLQELKNIDPSVQFKVFTSPNTSAFLIRGIGTSSFSAGIEQSVSTVLDGVVLGDPSTVATLTDIDHVEILKGPQGLLFGRNASSGVVSIQTNDPKLNRFEGITHLSFGDRGEQILQGIVNVPINDTMAARFTITHNELDGFAKDPLFGGDGINPTNITAGTAKFLWKPTESFRLVVEGDYSYTGEFCCTQFVRATPDVHAPVAVADAQYGIVASPNNFSIPDGARPFGYGKVYGTYIKADYDYKGYDFQSISAYRQAIRSNFYDADFTPINFADINGGTSDIANYSEEFRITSPVGPRFDWVAGAFVYIQRNQTSGTQVGYFPAGPNATGAQPAVYIPNNTITVVGRQVLQTDSQRATVTSQDYAGYAQGRFHFTDQITLSFGGRVTHDDLKLHLTSGAYWAPQLPLRAGNGYVGYAGPFVTPCITPPSASANCFPAVDQTTEDTNFSYRVTLEDQFTPDLMAYFTHARGYKGPGFSALSPTPSTFTVGTGAPADQRILAEIPTTYEIGLKSQILGRRLVLNIDAFDTDYTNFQAQVSTPTPNGFLSIIHNAGSVSTYGVELSTIARLLERLTLSGGLTYLHARYGDFPGVTCYSHYAPTATNVNATAVEPGCSAPGNAPGTINARGLKVANAPDWQATLSLDYERPRTFGPLTLFVVGTYNWQDSVFYQTNNDPYSRQTAFDLFGGEIGFGPDNGRWRLSVYATNLFDRHWAASISPAPTTALNPGGYIQYDSPDAFRHVGVKLDARF